MLAHKPWHNVWAGQVAAHHKLMLQAPGALVRLLSLGCVLARFTNGVLGTAIGTFFFLSHPNKNSRVANFFQQYYIKNHLK